MDDSESTISGRMEDTLRADRALGRLVRNVELTQNEEIDCTTCLEQVPIYVDRELTGAPVVEEMPELHSHLLQCGDCFEEYEALRDLVDLDSSGGLQDIPTLLNKLSAG